MKPARFEPAAVASGDETLLVELLRRLKALGYRFVAPTPATHARVLARPGRRTARDLADVLGWNLPFAPGRLGLEIERLLGDAGLLEPAHGLLRSRLRVASLGDWLFLHSAFPTDAAGAVFFGPDSYRFADLIRAGTRDLSFSPGARIVDIGAGTGVGALVAGRAFPAAGLLLTDINPAALRLARINAAAAGVPVRTLEGAGLAGLEGAIDLALANPPYIADEAGRFYRDGGGMLGAEVSVEMARAAAGRLAAGGRLILYTGSAIVRGEDRLAAMLSDIAAASGLGLRYRELDPDVFGEELERPAYAGVDRIALIAAVFDRPA